MNKNTRKAVIAGNWKMNMTPSETKKLLAELIPMVEGKNGCDIVVCVPFVDIDAAVAMTRGTNIKVGAQNVHFEKNGAFTGEISADMLKECGAEYVVIGHSERRQYFGETDVTVNLRLKAALAAGLTPILCVGELLDERDRDITAEVVAMQTKIALLDVIAEDAKKIIIAYEPVWAIGTGRTATPEQAEEVCEMIRTVVRKLYSSKNARAISILYGGSMNEKNAYELLAQPDIDGGLIGGASLVPEKFVKIIEAANQPTV